MSYTNRINIPSTYLCFFSVFSTMLLLLLLLRLLLVSIHDVLAKKIFTFVFHIETQTYIQVSCTRHSRVTRPTHDCVEAWCAWEKLAFNVVATAATSAPVATTTHLFLVPYQSENRALDIFSENNTKKTVRFFFCYFYLHTLRRGPFAQRGDWSEVYT